MANAVRRRLGFSEYDLVCYYRGSPAAIENDQVFSALRASARNITLIDRQASALSQMASLFTAVGCSRRDLLLAQISNEFILSVFRLRPKLRMHTFDEGGFNTSIDGPFFKPKRRRLTRLRDVFSFLLFPKGQLQYVKAKSLAHYTSFPVELNFMRDQASPVPIEWSEYLDPNESHLAAGMRRIMVLPCFTDFEGSRETRRYIAEMAQACDVVARHPRDTELEDIRSVRLRSPVEAIVEVASASGPVEVLHYASTVGLTLVGRKDVSVVDLSGEASLQAAQRAGRKETDN